MAGSNKFSGARRFAHELAGTDSLSTFHVKAHRELEVLEGLEGDERRFGFANRAVDGHAKKALEGHPRPNPTFLQHVELYQTRADAFVKLASEILPLFRNEVRWKRAPFFSAGRSRQEKTWHLWRRTELGMQCRYCWMVCDRPERPMFGCRGPPPALQKLLRDPLGHQLVAVSGSALDAPRSGLVLGPCREQQILCIKCGGWSQGRAVKLAEVCGKPTRKGLDVLSRFRRGLSPNLKVKAVLDKALPVSQLDVARDPAEQPDQCVTSVPRAFSDSPTAPAFEQRMAALVARIKAKEEARASGAI